MAEDSTWIKSAAVFEAAAAYDNERFSIDLNQLRRRLLRAASFSDVDPDDVALILRRRENFLKELAESTALKRRFIESAKEPLPPLDVGVEGRDAVTTLYLATIAAEEAPNIPRWGRLKSPEEQARSVREVICYVTGDMEAAATGLKVESDRRRGDFNDFNLCAYCGAGYYVVTSDERFVRNVRGDDRGGCEDSRVLRLDEGLALAEAWLEQPEGFLDRAWPQT
jgi:hypothetical protein